jgi:hypothetical protein
VSAEISGVGQPGFVSRYGLTESGLAGPGRAAAVNEVTARIREPGLRTVRLVVVDQHGIPRGKMMSPEAAVAAMSDGLDFSGAIYSLDTGNQVFVPAFARGGGFGIAEFTGFPDVVVVPDPAARPRCWRRRTPASLPRPRRSACSSAVTSSCPRYGWTAWGRRSRPCGTR